MIKIIRELTGLGLKEAKYVVDYLPHTVIEGLSRVQAEQIVDIFHNIGANCVIVAQDTI